MLLRNLIYQICPLSCNTIWEDNVHELQKYLHHFNGEQHIIIKTGRNMLPEAEVRKQFKNTKNLYFHPVSNDKHMDESTGLLIALKALHRQQVSGITFYAHSKGVSPKYLAEDYINIQQWNNLMYAHNLKDLSKIERILSKYYCCGCFKRNKYFKNLNAPWHYSGTFFWFNNVSLFSTPGWDSFETDKYFIEGYLGRLFDSNKAYCLFGEDCGNLYQYTATDWAKLGKISPKKPSSNLIKQIKYNVLSFPT